MQRTDIQYQRELDGFVKIESVFKAASKQSHVSQVLVFQNFLLSFSEHFLYHYYSYQL